MATLFKTKIEAIYFVYDVELNTKTYETAIIRHISSSAIWADVSVGWINARYWWAQSVPHTVDCIDIRSRAHLSTSCCLYTHHPPVKRERKDEIWSACLCLALKQREYPEAQGCLGLKRIQKNVVKAVVKCSKCSMCIVTPQRRIMPKKTSWETALTDSSITTPTICWMILKYCAWLAWRTQTTGKALMEIWALFISQQPTMMTSLPPLCPSQFITSLWDNYSHKIRRLRMTNQNKTAEKPNNTALFFNMFFQLLFCSFKSSLHVSATIPLWAIPDRPSTWSTLAFTVWEKMTGNVWPI